MKTEKLVSKEEVLEMMDKFFEPDITVKVSDSGEILSYVPRTKVGAIFADKHKPLLYRKYDEVLSLESGVCFEQID